MKKNLPAEKLIEQHWNWHSAAGGKAQFRDELKARPMGKASARARTPLEKYCSVFYL
jgi:hypothetical protein